MRIRFLLVPFLILIYSATAIRAENEPATESIRTTTNASPEKECIVKYPQKTCDNPAAIAPVTATNDPADKIEVNFEKADLQNVLSWISQLFTISFLTDDALDPKPNEGKNLVSNKKISFKTQKPLTKLQVWNLFISFLDLWGLSLRLSEAVPNLYEVVTTTPNVANTIGKGPLATYIGINWRDLPESDIRVRYVYFVQTGSLPDLQQIANDLRSSTAYLQAFKDLNALIITDKSANIRSLMQIIQELDESSAPETMTVIKLKNADAREIQTVLENLLKPENTPISTRLFSGPRLNQQKAAIRNIRMLGDERTNSLILIGAKEDVQRAEEFITKYVDTDINLPYSPLFVYTLQYGKAEDIRDILTKVVKFAPNSYASQYGGVVNGEKYFQPMEIVAEPETNRLLIKAERDDYLKVEEIIKELDVPQMQIALEVMIIQIQMNNEKNLGVQFRNKHPSYVNVQNTGFPFGPNNQSGAVTSSTGSLLGNLVSLAGSSAPGSTLISIGTDATLGVWGMFQILQTQLNTQILSNPFLVTTNKYPAIISLGQTRRVTVGNVVQTSGTQQPMYGDQSAALTVQITPQINNDGIINLDLIITLENFTNGINQSSTTASTDPSQADKTSSEIKTNANVANKEILAVGGLLQDTIIFSESKVPVLGDIPLLGWLFKNRAQNKAKNHILVFVSPRIIEPRAEGGMSDYSANKIELSQALTSKTIRPKERRDPIHRWFFAPDATEVISDYVGEATSAYQQEDQNSTKLDRPARRPENDSKEIAPETPAVIAKTNIKKNGNKKSVFNHFLADKEQGSAA